MAPASSRNAPSANHIDRLVATAAMPNGMACVSATARTPPCAVCGAAGFAVAHVYGWRPASTELDRSPDLDRLRCINSPTTTLGRRLDPTARLRPLIGMSGRVWPAPRRRYGRCPEEAKPDHPLADS